MLPNLSPRCIHIKQLLNKKIPFLATAVRAAIGVV